MQQPTLDPDKRTWHITFGTYATRLHDDDRPTVDRRHNQPDTPFPDADPDRQRPPGDRPIRLTRPQRMHVETMVAPICELGKWHLRTASAAIEGDHVHVLLDAAPSIDPKRIRRWLKRWLGESLSEAFGKPPRGWWAEGGSTRPVRDVRYLRNVTGYVHRQRTTPEASRGVSPR